jgi:uncharacterized membrane protein
MIFRNPEWLLIIPVLAVAGWYWRGLRLQQPLRLICLILLVLILIRPQVNLVQKGMDLWVLVDRSESAQEMVDVGLPEWRKLLEKSKPTRHDRIIYVDYAAEVIAEGVADSDVFPGKRHLTRAELALENTLAMINPEKPSRILMFTDGYATEPLTELSAKLVNSSTPLDYRLLQPKDAIDYRIANMSLPPRVQIAEPFMLEIAVRGNADGKVPITVYRNDEQLQAGEVEIIDGEGLVRFSDRIGQPGAYRYSAVIAPAEDAFFGNNQFETWIEITGGPRILLVTKYTDDPVAAALGAQGFDVETVLGAENVRVGQLAGARAVILNNVPAFEAPTDFQSALDFYVRHQGGGLLMAGGKQSFGSGGYFQSPVDDLLPVTMELKDEHRKLSVAMAMVADRSGSMGMTVPGGRTKMDLANEGAGRAVELLGENDLITVFAVDSAPDTIVPLTQVGGNRNTIDSNVRRIRSGGGGIYVYTGLKRAWEELKNAPVGTRHVILFSDAADSEEPGQYKSLITEMIKNGCTISVIGLGTDADPDADFLKDIALRGNGRIFFTDDAVELPNIFAQETVTAARSAFIDEPVDTMATGSWYEIASGNFDWLKTVDGYNLSYLRPKDTAALLSVDEYKSPLVAFGNRGVGRTAAVSFPLGGEYSQGVRDWPKYGDFLQTLGRWLMGEELPPGAGMRSRIEGTRLTVDLFYNDATWEERFAKDPPQIVLTEGTSTDSLIHVVWQRMSPGHYSASADLVEGTMTRGAVQLGKAAIPFGPMVVGTRTEWAFDNERVEDLRQTSAQSGGKEIVDLKDAWSRPQRKMLSDIRLPLLIALLIGLLLDALITRTGWRMPEFALAARTASRHATKRDRKLTEENAKRIRAEAAKAKEDEARRKEKTSSPIAPTPEELGGKPAPRRTTADERRSRFKRAKKGK